MQEITDHTSCVNALSYTADGKAIATASCDKTTKLWNSKTGEQVGEILSNDAAMHCVEMREDGLLAIGDDQGIIHIYDSTTDQKLTMLDHQGAEIHSLAWSPDGKYLASTNYDVGARVWSTTDWTYTVLPSVKNELPCSLTFAPDSKTLATGCTNGNILLWDVPSLTRKTELHRHDLGHIRCLTFTPNGNELISGGDDKRVLVWNVDTAQVIRTIRGHRKRLQSISVSPDGTMLASASLDGTVKVWNLNNPFGRIPHLRIESNRATYATIAPAGNQIAFAADESTDQIEIWSIPQAKPISYLSVDPIPYSHVLWSADNQALILIESDQKAAYIWDLKRKKSLGSINFDTPLAPGRLAVSPFNNEIAAVQSAMTGLPFYDLHAGMLRILPYPGIVIDSCYFPDGKTIACIGFADNDVHLLSEDGKSDRVLTASLDRPPTKINVSENANFLVVGDQGGVVRVIDVKRGQLHNILRGHKSEVSCIAVSHQSKSIASADIDGNVKLWHLETGELITTFSTGQARPTQVLFSPDDSALLCMCSIPKIGCELYIWSAGNHDE